MSKKRTDDEDHVLYFLLVFWMCWNTKARVGHVYAYKLMWIEVECQQNSKSISHVSSLEGHINELVSLHRYFSVQPAPSLFTVHMWVPSRKNSYFVSPSGSSEGFGHFENGKNIFCQIKLGKENLHFLHRWRPWDAW